MRDFSKKIGKADWLLKSFWEHSGTDPSVFVNMLQYLKTRFVRVLVAMVTATQHLSRSNFRFVPLQDFSKPWTDVELYAKYGLTDEETAFIESMIKPME